MGQIHDPVPDQRSHLVTAVLHGNRPGQAQSLDIATGYLLERTVALAVAGAAPAQPVAFGWRRQHRLGHRFEILDRPVDETGFIAGGFVDGVGRRPAFHCLPWLDFDDLAARDGDRRIRRQRGSQGQPVVDKQVGDDRQVLVFA